MKDPIPPVPWLSRAVEPFSRYVGFTTLPLHIHEVLLAFSVYTYINYWAAPAISKWLFPVRYTRLSRDKKLNWDVHVVSLFQSALINVTALWVMFVDKERKNMDWQQRVWGYTGGCGLVQGLATGYFLWDLMVSIRHVKAFGVGMLAHAISALFVFSFGYRPFVNFYACNFILYELSTPFLNFHWFFDKLDMTGSMAQLFNGIILLCTFFGCRLVWGTYQSIKVYQDVWAALHHTPAAAEIHWDAINNATSAAYDAAAGISAAPIHGEIMKFASEEYVPFWLAVIYLGSNVVLNSLNFYWFKLMIDAIVKRFTPAKDKKREKAAAIKTTGVNGSVKIDVDETEVRRRIVAAQDDEEEEEIPIA